MQHAKLYQYGRHTGMLHNGMKVVDPERVQFIEDATIAERLNIAGDAQRVGAFEKADEVLRHLLASNTMSALPIDTLCPLTTRTLNTFDAKEIASLADLVRLPLHEVRDWYNFGKDSLALLGGRMRVLGINFTDRQDYTWIKFTRAYLRKQTRIDCLLILPTFTSSQADARL